MPSEVSDMDQGCDQIDNSGIDGLLRARYVDVEQTGRRRGWSDVEEDGETNHPYARSVVYKTYPRSLPGFTKSSLDPRCHIY